MNSASTNATSGVQFTFTVIALDDSAKVIPGYSGTVHFTSSDTQALLPADSKLSNGTGSFSLTFKTVGNQFIFVADTVKTSITGKSAPITVAPAGSLTNTTAPLPVGTVGLTYGSPSIFTPLPPVCSVSFTGWQLRATGGLPPYSWTLNPAPGSAVPPGLSISTKSNFCGGTTRCCTTVTATFIGGTPTVAGTYSVILTVNDSASPPVHSSQTYAIVVNKAKSAAAPASSEKPDPSPSAHLRYRLTDLGPLDEHLNDRLTNGSGIHLLNNQGDVASNNSAVNSINERGWMTGLSHTGAIDPVTGSPVNHATLWKGDGILDLGTLDGQSSEGIYADDAGQVVGIAVGKMHDPSSLLGNGVQVRTFVWRDGAIRDIGTLGGADTLPGLGCKATRNGFVVGQSYVNDSPNAGTGMPTLHPFLWNDGLMIDLGTLGGTLGRALCANNRGQVIGTATLSGDIVQHAFVWDENTRRMEDLGTLGGDNSEADWINDSGEIAGYADLSDGSHHAVVWKDGQIIDLGAIPGDPCSSAHAINARGQVVGASSDCEKSRRAFLSEQGESMLDLNSLVASDSGVQLTNAFNINERGEILATAVPTGVTLIDAESNGRLVLLIPCKSPQEKRCQIPTAEDSNSTISLTPLTARPSRSHRITAIDAADAWRSRLARQYPLRAPGPHE